MKLELNRIGTTTRDDLSRVAADLRGIGFEVDEGKGFEKSADVLAGLGVVVWLVVDQSAREFISLGLGYLLDKVLGLSRKYGATKVNIRFRAGGEDGTELNLSIRSDEPDAMKTTQGIVRDLAEVGMVSALAKMPDGEKLAYLSLDLATSIYCRTRGPSGQFYFYDTKTRRWKPGKVKKQ